MVLLLPTQVGPTPLKHLLTSFVIHISVLHPRAEVRSGGGGGVRGERGERQICMVLLLCFYPFSLWLPLTPGIRSKMLSRACKDLHSHPRLLLPHLSLLLPHLIQLSFPSSLPSPSSMPPEACSPQGKVFSWEKCFPALSPGEVPARCSRALCASLCNTTLVVTAFPIGRPD